MANPRKSFTTPKGTELPLLSLKGREYLQVAHRLVWFRQDHPTGVIRTMLKAQGGEGKAEYAVFQAEIHIMTDKGPMLVATAHKKETAGGFPDFLEKAETGSIGRALALLGYGTQFTADELDEGNRLADSPMPTPTDYKTETVSTVSKLGPDEVVAPAAPAARRASFRKNVVAPVAAVTSGDDI